MTEGGAVEAATITAVYEAVLEHHQDHRHDIPSTHASALDCPTILHALQAAKEEAEVKVQKLSDSYEDVGRMLAEAEAKVARLQEALRAIEYDHDFTSGEPHATGCIDGSCWRCLARAALSDEGRTEEVTR
jgi:chromosome segregation ATPase